MTRTSSPKAMQTLPVLIERLYWHDEYRKADVENRALRRQRDDYEKVVAAARALKWGDMLHGYHCHGGDQQSPCTCGISDLRAALDTKPTER